MSVITTHIPRQAANIGALSLLLTVTACGNSETKSSCDDASRCAPNSDGGHATAGSSSGGASHLGGSMSFGGSNQGGIILGGSNLGGASNQGGVGLSSSNHGGTAPKASRGTAGNGGSVSAAATWGSSAGSSAELSCNYTQECDESKPWCNPDTRLCVACLEARHCKDPSKPLCSPSNTCVQCQSSNDCSAASAPICDFVTGTCAGCQSDSDCAKIVNKGVCLSGSCVQCTVNNESACENNKNSCDPATNTCTGTQKGSVDICMQCKTDSECKGGNIATPTALCVAMTFGESAVKHGSYCLNRVGASCVKPYSVPINSPSVSGAGAEPYCGISQTTTTCEAVLDMIASKECLGDNGRCGSGLGGFCKQSASTNNYVCTIPCAESVECTALRTCSPDPVNTAAPSYCQ